MTLSCVVVLPVFRPDPGHLSAQIASIARQTIASVHVVFVVADGTSSGTIREFAASAGLDFTLVEPGQPLDAPRAVEAGLVRALPMCGEDTVIALSDQDDLWHPDRLGAGRTALDASGAWLAHGDARLVDAEGKLRHPSMFKVEGRHRNPGLRNLLLRNSVTGMTVTMRPALVALALPFPPQAGVHFYHDLWLALLAQATAGITVIDRPLVDYRQHGANVMGAIDRTGGMRLRIGLPDALWLRREAARYALARYLAQSLQNRLADAVADGQLRHGLARTRALWPYLSRLRGAGGHLWDMIRLAATGHLRLARIAFGHAASSLGRAGWSLREALGPGLRAAVDQFDERLYSLSPGMLPVVPRHMAPPDSQAKPAEKIIDQRKIARFRAAFTAPAPAVVILVPTLNPTEIFAGIATALDIGAGLAQRGLTVRFVATDLPVSSPDASRQFIEGRLPAEKTGARSRIQIGCGVTNETLPFHARDRFLATAWWTAHLIEGLRPQGFRAPGFLYLLQDYEPNFYAWGPEFADAAASYDLQFTPIFNSTTLRDYFAMQGHGFATQDAPSFQPSIDIGRYARGRRPPALARRRLAVYGRPEVARNMFPTAVEALGRFLATEAVPPDRIELLSVGMKHENITLPGGHVLVSLGKLPMHDYPDWLMTVDVGLSLMLSPHPSHPPLEMAAAGARVVTNRFASKDLGRLTPAILSVEGTVDGIAAGLSRAWAMGPADDAARNFDLAALGQPLDRVIDRLAADLTAGWG